MQEIAKGSSVPRDQHAAQADPHGSVPERLLGNPGARLVSIVADATRAKRLPLILFADREAGSIGGALFPLKSCISQG